MKHLLLALLTLKLAAPVMAAETIEQHSLFRIERSKNANVVQYDARVGPDGRFAQKDPIVVYWLRLAEDGREQQLSWLQRTFAYGFKAEMNEQRDQATLRMQAPIGRPVNVRCGPSDCRVTTVIDGEQAYLHRIFVNSHGKGLGTQVDFIELFGEDVNGGGERYERIEP
jgi:hypothetical protein